MRRVGNRHANVAMSLILVMNLFMPAAVRADDVQLTPELPSEDKQVIVKPVLNGEVSKEDSRAQALESGANEQAGKTDSINMAALEAARAKDNAAMDLAKLGRAFTLTVRTSGLTITKASFLNLQSRRPKMTTEEFRKLEYGVIGMESIVHLDGSGPFVTTVYPTCPAANAGIRTGDLIVKANNYVFRRGDGQRVLWQIIPGKADTPVDITILRDGELVTLHLTRMNIEDIRDDGIRQTYENLLNALGPPQN